MSYEDKNINISITDGTSSIDNSVSYGAPVTYDASGTAYTGGWSYGGSSGTIDIDPSGWFTVPSDYTITFETSEWGEYEYDKNGYLVPVRKPDTSKFPFKVVPLDE